LARTGGFGLAAAISSVKDDQRRGVRLLHPRDRHRVLPEREVDGEAVVLLEELGGVDGGVRQAVRQGRRGHPGDEVDLLGGGHQQPLRLVEPAAGHGDHLLVLLELPGYTQQRAAQTGRLRELAPRLLDIAPQLLGHARTPRADSLGDGVDRRRSPI